MNISNLIQITPILFRRITALCRNHNAVKLITAKPASISHMYPFPNRRTLLSGINFYQRFNQIRGFKFLDEARDIKHREVR